MKICIPTIDNEKQLSQVCDHFGSAPYFTIYDFAADAYETVNNTGHDHEHGMCHPMNNLTVKNIDAVICKGLGGRALLKLKDGGIKVLRTNQSTVKDIVDGFAENKLEEIDPENACQNHSCH